MMMLDITDLIGASFRMGGRGPEFDCTGLVLEIYRRAGIDAPDPAIVFDSESFWDCIGPDVVWKPMDTLGFESENAPGFVDHHALYLGWGLLFHIEKGSTAKVQPVGDIPGKVLAVYRPKSCCT